MPVPVPTFLFRRSCVNLDVCSFLFVDLPFRRHFSIWMVPCSVDPFSVKKHPQYRVHCNTLRSGGPSGAAPWLTKSRTCISYLSTTLRKCMHDWWKWLSCHVIDADLFLIDDLGGRVEAQAYYIRLLATNFILNCMLCPVGGPSTCVMKWSSLRPDTLLQVISDAEKAHSVCLPDVIFPEWCCKILIRSGTCSCPSFTQHMNSEIFTWSFSHGGSTVGYWNRRKPTSTIESGSWRHHGWREIL